MYYCVYITIILLQGTVPNLVELGEQVGHGAVLRHQFGRHLAQLCQLLGVYSNAQLKLRLECIKLGVKQLGLVEQAALH